MNEKKNKEMPIPFKLDDFFTTQEIRDEKSKEKIEEIDLSLIDDFKEHPFKVAVNDELLNLEKSIKDNGVLNPVIVRKKDNGRYEMISGHRRKFACNRIGYDRIPCIIKNLTDDEATIYMVDSNLQREKLLPSEKAFAYKLKMEALSHQGTYRQYGETSRQLGDKVKSVDVLASESEDSARQIHRYIRLTYLIPELLELVDNSELNKSKSLTMAFNPAVELSYLNKDEQEYLFDYIDSNQITPSLSQAIKLKKLSMDGKLDIDVLEELLNQEKPNQVQKIKFNERKIKSVLPKNIERDKIEDYVVKSIEYYTKYLNRQKERESR